MAVDLSIWVMQADQQVALLPLFSQVERCMKVRGNGWVGGKLEGFFAGALASDAPMNPFSPIMTLQVAFERSVQWLRHGCLPVIVVEGQAPPEKRAAQQARWAAANGGSSYHGGGGGGGGGAQFQRLGLLVAGLLQELVSRRWSLPRKTHVSQ